MLSVLSVPVADGADTFSPYPLYIQIYSIRIGVKKSCPFCPNGPGQNGQGFKTHLKGTDANQISYKPYTNHNITQRYMSNAKKSATRLVV